MGERRALVIASQCESLNLLSFLPEAAKEVADALLDEQVGGCVPALADGRRMLVDPTMLQLDDAVTEAFERASADEATLVIALVGHGDYAADDFYFLTRDTTGPANSRNAFTLAQRIKELLGHYSLLDGLVILLDTCHAGVAAEQAAHRWIRIVGEAGKRFEVLTASDDRTAADGCFSRSLATILRSGRPEFGELVRCPDLKRAIGTLCPTQTAVHLAFDGVRTVEKGDQGLWLARNNDEAWRPLLGNPAAGEIERLTEDYLPSEELGEVVGLLMSGTRCVQVLGYGGEELVAALARPSVAAQYVPAKFLQAVVFATTGQTVEQVVNELARQLRHALPEFGEAQVRHLEDNDVTGEDAFDRAVLSPLRGLTRTAPVRIALVVHKMAGWDRGRLFGSLGTLVADPRLGWVRLVLAQETEASVPGSRSVHYVGSWMQREQERGITPPWGNSGTFEGAPPPLEEREEADTPADEQAEWPPTTVGPVRELLDFVRDGDRLPIGVLVAGSRRAGGPDRLTTVRDALTLMGGEVSRHAPGTAEETVRATYVRYYKTREQYGLLADAIAEAAPVDDKARETPEQRYATANEAEYLWLAGRREEALRSVGERLSDVPVENRERWAVWAQRASRELGEEHPLTLLCRARQATWAGKSGDAASALAQFQDLAATAESLPGMPLDELLSIRNNLAYQLMELRRFEQARTEFAALASYAADVLGADDRETLHARQLFAVATGKCGDGGESLRLSRELLPDAERALDPDDDLLRNIQHSIVFWTAHSGGYPPPGVSELYQRLLERTRRKLNDRHPDMLELRFLGALLLANSGRVDKALGEWAAQLADAAAVLGERHPFHAQVREQLAHWGPAR
jgi:hypothetical protein